MINTVAQGVLDRNWSLSLDQVLRSARIWHGRENTNPVKMKLCPGCHSIFASSKQYQCLQGFFSIGICLETFAIRYAEA